MHLRVSSGTSYGAELQLRKRILRPCPVAGDTLPIGARTVDFANNAQLAVRFVHSGLLNILRVIYAHITTLRYELMRNLPEYHDPRQVLLAPRHRRHSQLFYKHLQDLPGIVFQVRTFGTENNTWLPYLEVRSECS